MVADAEGAEALLERMSCSDGLFCVDGSQRIVHWGDSARRMLGYTSEEVLGRPCYEVLGGREPQNSRSCRRDCPVITNARRGRTSGDYDLLAHTKDGSDVWVNVSVLVLDAGPKRGPLALHLFRDVDERRQVESLARRAVAAIGELATAPDRQPAREAHAGSPLAPQPALTKRELQVLRLLASGLGTEEIAENLSISPVTARNHITHLVTKLGARNRLQAVLYASRRGLV